MTIREYLDRRERPYKRDSKIFLAMLIVSGVALLILFKTNAFIMPGGGFEWQFWALLAAGCLYLTGGIGFVATGIVLIILIRCPRCNKRLRTRTQRWRYCPMCGVDFEAEAP